MLVLDKLWRGEISPYNTHIKKGSEYSQVMKELSRQEAAIQEELTEKGRDLFTDIQDLQIDLSARETQEAFTQGFRLGMCLLLDALSDNDGDFTYAGEQ